MSEIRRIVDGEFIEGATSTDDPDLNQAFWDFRNAIEQEANAGGSIAVFEVPTDAVGAPRPTSIQRPKLFTVPVGSFTLDDICDRVLREFVEPGGKIMIQLLARKDGERGIKMNKLVSLRRGRESAQPQGASDQIAQLMRVMNEQRAQDRADMQRMLEAMGANRPPAGNSLSEALVLAEKLAGIGRNMVSPGGAMGAPSDPNNIMNQMMAMMMTRMMKDFFDKRDAPREPDAGASTILENIRALAAPLLTAKATQEERALVAEKRMLMHERANPSNAPAPQGAPTAPEKTEEPKPAAAPSPSSAQKDEAKMKLLAVLKEGLPMIVSLAKGPKPADPAETAKLVLKNLPEDEQALNDAFYALVQDPPADFLGQLAVVCPEVREHAEWFEAFRQALLIEFDPDKLTPA